MWNIASSFRLILQSLYAPTWNQTYLMGKNYLWVNIEFDFAFFLPSFAKTLYTKFLKLVNQKKKKCKTCNFLHFKCRLPFIYQYKFSEYFFMGFETYISFVCLLPKHLEKLRTSLITKKSTKVNFRGTEPQK